MRHDFLCRGFGNIIRIALFDKTANQRLNDLAVRYINGQLIPRLEETVLKRGKRWRGVCIRQCVGLGKFPRDQRDCRGAELDTFSFEKTLLPLLSKLASLLVRDGDFRWGELLIDCRLQ